MKSLLHFVCILLLYSLSLNAQENSIIVTKVKGQVEYLKTASENRKTLLPGTKITTTGTVHLAKDAKVNLLYNGKLIQFEGPGTYDLKTYAGKNDKTVSMSFAGRFWEFISDGLSRSDDKKSIKEYSERLLAVSGGVSGYAMDESSFRTIMPAEGNIGVELVTFSWNNVKNPSANYYFKIYRSNEQELVFKAIIKDTSITLDFNQLVFHPNEPYEWSIEVEQPVEKEAGETEEEEEDHAMIKSDLKTFEYFSNADELIAQKASKIKDYEEADNFEKQWMEAIIMEQENFIYDAYNRYTDLRLQHPDNLLIKKLFAAFLVRQGLTQQAINQID